MAKKDKNDSMGQVPVQELDKERRTRLEKFLSQWDETPGTFMMKELTLPDLRLLLEHYSPLQDLIRAIAGTAQGSSPLPAAQQTSDLCERLQDTAAQTQAATAAQLRTEAEADDLRQQCEALQHDLKQCSAATQKLLQEKTSAQEAFRQLEKQLQQAQKELTTTRTELARAGTAPAELTLLRDDVELARRLELTDLPSDTTQALIRIVAVLAQRDNLERLWAALKDRCEAENRPAHTAERALLAAALSWYNHNWRSKPYQLVEVAPGMAYDFERHLRSQHTTSGEKINELRLPGIADGSSRLSCKALVSTR